MSALKIKNADGTWTEIPMLTGDPGAKGDPGKDADPAYRVNVEPVILIQVGPDGKLEADFEKEISFSARIDEASADAYGGSGTAPEGLTVTTDNEDHTITFSASSGTDPLGADCYRYDFPCSIGTGDAIRTITTPIHLVKVKRGLSYILTAQDKADIYELLLAQYPAVEEVSF